MNWEVIWESIKAPARQALLFAYAFALNKLFELGVTYLGFEFTPEQKMQILGFGTPIVWWLLSWVDRILHTVGKKKDEASTKRVQVESVLTKGIARF